jgi:methyl-accepting chemotaxis protein
MLNNFSIKQIFIGLAITLTLLMGTNKYLVEKQLHNIESAMHDKDNEILQHLFRFLELQKDVIQVQQWLTDISATRAKPGFDDGFGEAKIYFEDGNRLLDELIEAHTQYNEPEMVSGLNEFKENFASFYDIGIKMANIYIKDGAEAGNKMMLKLDPFAEKLTDDLGVWIKEHHADNSASSIKVTQNVEKLDQTLFIISIIIYIVVLTLLFITSQYITTQISSLTTYLDQFFKFLRRENEDITIIPNTKNEFNTLITSVNKSQIGIQDENKQDKSVFDEILSFSDKLAYGYFEARLNQRSQNPRINYIIDALNSLGEVLEQNTNNILQVMEEFSHYKYNNKVSQTNLESHLLRLANSINIVGETTSNMLVKNKQDGEVLTDVSKTLLENVNILNQNSNSAATQLEQTSAALEEVTSNITSNTENVVKMASYAKTLTVVVQEGQNLANQTSNSMDDIDTEVKSIAEAITIIDQIAFQTNILSLNAAVEAATAGEAGKGFAVVAQEVRNLASRSAEAANEIKTLVENATLKATQGKDISSNMIHGYTTLSDNINKTTELISTVENAAKEQKVAIEQINDSVNELDNQTQQNAKIASDTNDVATNTNNIALNIIKSVDEKEFIGQ